MLFISTLEIGSKQTLHLYCKINHDTCILRKSLWLQEDENMLSKEEKTWGPEGQLLIMMPTFIDLLLFFFFTN